MKNTEFFEALELLERERGVPVKFLAEKIESAVITALRKDYAGEDNIKAKINIEKRKFEVSVLKMVVENVEDPATEILIDEAKKHSKRAVVGSPVEIKIETKKLGRIVAQNAKHIIRQGFREAERSIMLEEFQSKIREIVSATVQKVDEKRGIVTLEISGHEAILPAGEHIPGENLREGSYTKVYVVDVLSTEKGPKLMISRTHPGLVTRMFEMEVPEISDGVVEIKSVAREAGYRTKLAVLSNDKNVDPVGACIGERGSRIDVISEELQGEKFDVIPYSDDPKQFIAAALAPAKVVSVDIPDENVRQCSASVPDNQLSLAIGNKGQNVRLAAKLTGFKIDIRPESGYFGE